MKISKYVQLHFIILLWGFTPVLGKLISIDAYDLVWYRLLFSALSLYIYMRYKGISLRIKKKNLLIILATGLIVGIHWFFFYYAIKVSNVSATMAGFSTVTLFGSLFQPLLLKKKFYWTDVIYGIAISGGLIVILNFESIYFWGIFYGIIAAITAAFFGIYNGKLIQKNNAVVITFYEFIGALFFISILKLFNHSESYFPTLNLLDLIWLLVLSLACTTLAFTLSVEILKYFTPLTVIITNNLEPIYGIVFSIIIFGQSEYMSFGFYIGIAIILLSVFTYPFISAKFKK
ncbi:MAG: DMT family transporter [Bacteroidota bacterium]|jgi:drug/metabolite transporter (DMT)-like permease